jgi:hypothetical protein
MITQRKRWVPGSPRIRCFEPSIEERKKQFMGHSEVSFIPPKSHSGLGVLVPPTAGLAVDNFGLRLMPRLVLCRQTLNLLQMIQIMASERFQLHPQGDDPPLRVESGPPEVLLGGTAKEPNL